jgi:hypothetical protein
MKRFKDCADTTLYTLWKTPTIGIPLGEVYAWMAGYLYNQGYDDVTVNKVRRRIKYYLHQKRKVPRHATQADYHRSRKFTDDELN